MAQPCFIYFQAKFLGHAILLTFIFSLLDSKRPEEDYCAELKKSQPSFEHLLAHM